MSKKQMTYEDDYNELLNDLAEARNAANQVRAELLKDDSSPFNPKLSEQEAHNIIKKATKKPAQNKPSRKILKPLSSEESLEVKRRALMNSASNRNPKYHEDAKRIHEKLRSEGKE